MLASKAKILKRFKSAFHYVDGSKITIDDNGLISLDQSCRNVVSFPDSGRIPVSFDKIGGNFICKRAMLTSMQGFPTAVGTRGSNVTRRISKNIR